MVQDQVKREKWAVENSGGCMRKDQGTEMSNTTESAWDHLG